MNHQNKTFCPIPWVHQAVKNNGNFRICCQANVTENQGIVRKENGAPFNASIDSIDDAYNSELLKRIRLNMLNGEWNPECERCKIEEEAGLESRRPNEVHQWRDTFTIDDAVNATSLDGSVDISPVYYDLRFGNFCNLKCRMCGPTDSHAWYEEYVGWDNLDQPEKKIQQGFWDTGEFVELIATDKGRWTTDVYNWHEQETFWKNLEKNIENIQIVYMAGGEPLLIEKHYDFLQSCVDRDCAKNIRLEYNTNLSVLPKRVLDLWTHFKMVRVGSSIDGMEEVLEYQRYPLKWSTALKNLKALDDLAVRYDNIEPCIGYTVTAYNVFHFPRFIWWKLFESGFKKINGVERRPVISYHVLHEPDRLSVQMLPLHIKENLRSEYDMWKEKILISDLEENTKDTAIKMLEGVLNFTFLEDKTHQIEEFVKFTKFLDSKRNQDIKNYIPELGELFE